jgi:hypothetical protein
VIDTNVAVVANGRSNASPVCVIACTTALNEIKRLGCVVVDDGWRIINEYRHNLNEDGQPGFGDAFLKWLLSNLKNKHRCIQVHITQIGNDDHDFEEFPKHPRLAGFDPSDRKFVAIAATHPDRPPILQGSDSKWWGWKDPLGELGITVEFLCPDEIERTFKQKFP